VKRLRTVGRYAILTLLSLIVLELVCVAVYWIHDGALLSVQQELDRESSPYIHGKPGCLYVESLYPHPYLGYVFSKNPPCGHETISDGGMLGGDIPGARRPDKFVVLLTGGSLAVELLQFGGGSLAEELNRRFVIPGKEIVVVAGAVDAWKEPQQLILFLTHVRGVDAVITLDGYNELEIPKNARSAFELPWRGSVLATNPGYDATYAQIQELARAANGLYDFERGHWLPAHSKLVHFVLSQLRQHRRRQAAALAKSGEHPPMSLDTLFGAGTRGDDRRRLDETAQHYADYLRMMDAVAARFDVRVAHFLQPIAAWNKPLTDEEQRIVGSDDGHDYHDLVERLLLLRREGSSVFSLLDLYADWKETLYIDAVHPAQQSPGLRRMLEQIATLAGEAWHLPPRAPASRAR
jgi:hypothetical protein